MTYYTIEIINTLTHETYRYTNARNLGFARTLAERLSQCFRKTVVIDQTTGAVMAEYAEGEATYLDLDPYAGYEDR